MVSLKLGNSLFEKEKKILELTNENQVLNQKLSSIFKEYEGLLAYSKDFEKIQSELRNNLKLKEVEFDSLNAKYKKLSDDFKCLSESHQTLQSHEKENQNRIGSLNKEIDKLNMALLEAQDLELKLKDEIKTLEQKNFGNEKNIEQLNELLDSKDHKIGVLDKNLGHKDKYLAILMKEKNRLMKPNEPTKDQKGGIKLKENYKSSSALSEKSENKDYSNESDYKTSQISENPQIGILEKKLDEKQQEIEKLKKENFALSTRLRNVTVKK